MNFQDLNNEQRLYLKQHMLDQKLIETEDRTASIGELIEADELITDKELEDEFGGAYFTEEDFGL